MTKKIVFAIILIIILFFTLLFLKKKEKFINELNKKHGCISFTETMPPSISFSSPLKGWCSSDNYGDSEETNDFSHSGESKFKCPPSYSNLSPEKSLKYKSKARCFKEN